MTHDLIFALVCYVAAVVVPVIAIARACRERAALTFGECPICGEDRCFCDRTGDGWRDLMAAAREEEADWREWEQEVAR